MVLRLVDDELPQTRQEWRKEYQSLTRRQERLEVRVAQTMTRLSAITDELTQVFSRLNRLDNMPKFWDE